MYDTSVSRHDLHSTRKFNEKKVTHSHGTSFDNMSMHLSTGHALHPSVVFEEPRKSQKQRVSSRQSMDSQTQRLRTSIADQKQDSGQGRRRKQVRRTYMDRAGDIDAGCKGVTGRNR